MSSTRGEIVVAFLPQKSNKIFVFFVRSSEASVLNDYCLTSFNAMGPVESDDLITITTICCKRNPKVAKKLQLFFSKWAKNWDEPTLWVVFTLVIPPARQQKMCRDPALLRTSRKEVTSTTFPTSSSGWTSEMGDGSSCCFCVTITVVVGRFVLAGVFA